MKPARSRNSTSDLDPVAIKVWDPPVRLFHWSLVALLIGAIVSVKIGGSATQWHVRFGYAILALVLFRIVWGLVGTRTARFASFVHGPGAVIEYARSMFNGRHQTHVGHNPLGGWMIVLMLLALLAQAGLGLFSNDDIATDGPLVRLVTKEASDAITSWHRRGAWLLIGLAGLHIGAVVFYLIAFKENLVRPMVTGRKLLHAHHSGAGNDGERTLLAVVVLAVCAAGVWLVVSRP